MPSIIFAGNRQIGLTCLATLIRSGIQPVALLVPDGADAECTKEMEKLLPDAPCFRGKTFAESQNLKSLKKLGADYILSIHFPLIIPKAALKLARIGTLNLHPAYLPWNRGWHTPSWAIIDGTPFGATLHWIDEGLDTGPIALQKRIAVKPDDTAHMLYQRALKEEQKIFRRAIPLLKRHALPKVKQRGKGTAHRKSDLEAVRRIDLERMSASDIDRRVRGLTTNTIEEAAYIEDNGHRHLLRIESR